MKEMLKSSLPSRKGFFGSAHDSQSMQALSAALHGHCVRFLDERSVARLLTTSHLFSGVEPIWRALYASAWRGFPAPPAGNLSTTWRAACRARVATDAAWRAEQPVRTSMVQALRCALVGEELWALEVNDAGQLVARVSHLRTAGAERCVALEHAGVLLEPFVTDAELFPDRWPGVDERWLARRDRFCA